MTSAIIEKKFSHEEKSPADGLANCLSTENAYTGTVTLSTISLSTWSDCSDFFSVEA